MIRSLGGAGDALLMNPVFLGLKEKYGMDSETTIAVSFDYQAGILPALFKHNPYVDYIVRVEPHEFASPWLKRNRWEFKNVPNDYVPDCFIDTDLVIELSVICAETETREMNSPEGVCTHRTDIWCKAAGVNPSSKKPILNLMPNEILAGKKWCDDNLGEGVRVGVPLKTMSFIRNWPHTEYFIKMLHRQGYKVVTIDQGARIQDDIPALMGKPIRFVAAVIAHLDAVVSPDTGILHVAGALGTPIVGLFGSSNGDLRMREYCGVYVDSKHLTPCSPCWYGQQCLRSENKQEHALCMQRISPDLALFGLEQMLNKYGKLKDRVPVFV